MAEFNHYDFTRLIRDLDKSFESLIGEHDGLPVGRVDAARVKARSLGLTEEQVEHWLSLQTIVGDDKHRSAWPEPVRTAVREDLDFLAARAENPARFSTLWSLLGVMPTVQLDKIRDHHALLVSVTPASRRDLLAAARSRLLEVVEQRLLTDTGPAEYAASILADAADVIADDLWATHDLVGVLRWTEHLEPLAKRMLALGWGMTAQQAVDGLQFCLAGRGVMMATPQGVWDPRLRTALGRDGVYLVGLQRGSRSCRRPASRQSTRDLQLAAGIRARVLATS